MSELNSKIRATPEDDSDPARCSFQSRDPLLAWIALEEGFSQNGYRGKVRGIPAHGHLSKTSPVAFFAVHAVAHFTKEITHKQADTGTGGLVETLGSLIPALSTFCVTRTDTLTLPHPNRKTPSDYFLTDLARIHPQPIIIDLHTMRMWHDFEVAVGMGPIPFHPAQEHLLTLIQEAFVQEGMRVICHHRRYNARNSSTVTYRARQDHGINAAAQIEIGWEYMVPHEQPEKARKTLSALMTLGEALIRERIPVPDA